MNRTTVYMPLDEILPADRNPKRHDIPEIKKSLRRFGYADMALLDERTMKLVGGHGRLEALGSMRDDGDDPPRHVVVTAENVWTVPVQRGWESDSDAEAEAMGIALNRLTERGGWDPESLVGMLDDFLNTDLGLDGLGFDADELDDLVAGMQESTLEFTDDKGHDKTNAAQMENSIDERATEYARKGVRSLVLDYALNDFDEIAANCARLRRHRKLENNAALIKALVTEAIVTLPAAFEEADGAALADADTPTP